MKRILALLLVTVLLLSCVACKKDEKKNQQQQQQPAGQPVENPDITIDQIAWRVDEGEVEKDRYVICSYTNNSQYSITSFKLNFVQYPELTQDEFEEFYAAVRVSQGFSDEYMAKYIKDRDDKNLPITMYAQEDVPVRPGESANRIKCYYLGGFTSKNLIFHQLFVPDSATFSYEKEGNIYAVSYDFKTGKYVTAEMQGD